MQSSWLDKPGVPEEAQKAHLFNDEGAIAIQAQMTEYACIAVHNHTVLQF